jgi:hypothetical protein
MKLGESSRPSLAPLWARQCFCLFSAAVGSRVERETRPPAATGFLSSAGSPGESITDESRGRVKALVTREKNSGHRRALAIVMYEPRYEITMPALETPSNFRVDPC